ncbi:MAG: DNA primase [Gammaproteobacteria bacterium]|nr:DNA primase [Gammaproteobacteria bacterium]MCP5458021.1 DNA primase [Gammaproteobacteria bacterium]
MSTRIPQGFLDQLLARIDLVQIIEARLPLRKAGRDLIAHCPFHSEKSPSFSVSPSKQFYHCFGCGAHGNAIGFLMDYEHFSFMEAVEELARTVGMDIPKEASALPDKQSNLLVLVERAARYFSQQLREHPKRQHAVEYLKKRGLDEDIIERFGIGYAPPGWNNLCQTLGDNSNDWISAGLASQREDGKAIYDRFRDRIMFPIRDRRGRPIAFGARALGDATPKYLNSPETSFFHKGRELYGLYEARRYVRRIDRLLVVEGYMDVVALAQFGIPYVVATLGTATTSEHMERLFRITPDLIFCFDGDRAGRDAAWRALENALPFMREGRQIRFLFLPDGEDPDSLIRKEPCSAFEQRLQTATSLSDFLFERLGTTIERHSLDGRAKLAELARPLVAKVPDGVYRDMLLQHLTELTGLSQTQLEKRLPSSNTGLPRRNTEINPSRTPVRMAIGLLLNCTELAQYAGNMQRFRGIDVPGLPLLIELVELLQTHPYINVAALLERYRESETGSNLQRLAQWQPLIEETRFKDEFCGALETLLRRHSPEKRLLDEAIRKGQLDRLNDEEKTRLRELGKPSSSET